MNILTFSFINVTNLKKLNLNKRLITYLFIIFINIINKITNLYFNYYNS